jgi:hypothetical protein
MATRGYDLYATLADCADRAFELEDPATAFEFKQKVNRIAQAGARLNGSFGKEFVQEFGTRAVDPADMDLVRGLLQCLADNMLSDVQSGPRPAIWDHFKGGVYRVNKLSMWTEDGAPVVDYTSMIHGTDHIRRVSQWNEVVQWPDFRYRSRFVFRGLTLETRAPHFKVPSPVISL